MYHGYCLLLLHSLLLSSVLIDMYLFPLQIVFVERLALHPLMADSNNTKHLQLQRNIQHLVHILAGRHTGSRKTFAHLHPAASQSHIFGLKLQVNGGNGGILYPHIACQRVGNNHYCQCRIGNELRCLLLAIGQFLQFILLVHHYELPCIAAFRRGCHQGCFHQSDDLFLCQFFFCKLPHAAACFYQFTETFHNDFMC